MKKSVSISFIIIIVSIFLLITGCKTTSSNILESNGKGFSPTVSIFEKQTWISFQTVELFQDDNSLYISLNYSSNTAGKYSLFDPPNGTSFMLKRDLTKGNSEIIQRIEKGKLRKMGTEKNGDGGINEKNGDGGINGNKYKNIPVFKSKIHFLPILLYMRKPRYLETGAEYHVTAKINRGEFALKPKEIKELFLFTVKRAKKKYSFKLRSFVIMSNHIHLQIKPGKGENLSKIMQWILSVFARSFNKYYHLSGHVWSDRFKSKVIDSFQQLIATFKYICNNPVKANMVEDPEQYLYGSLWFLRHKLFGLVEPPDISTQLALTDL